MRVRRAQDGRGAGQSAQYDLRLAIARRQRRHLGQDQVAGEEAAMVGHVVARDNREGAVSLMRTHLRLAELWLWVRGIRP